MLEVRNVTRVFGQRTAVDDISFKVDGPQFIGIIGRSGAGKPDPAPPATRPRRQNRGVAQGRNGKVVPVKGLEPPTPSLRMTCSTS